MSSPNVLTCTLMAWIGLFGAVATSLSNRTGRTTAHVEGPGGALPAPLCQTAEAGLVEGPSARAEPKGRDVDTYRGVSASGDVCPSDGDCFSIHPEPGCEDEACCNMVCGRDPDCCSFGVGWDELCVRYANELCGCAGEGSCFVPNGSPSCTEESCCAVVCAEDPFCCDTEWDCLCAETAAVLCGDSACPGKGGCTEENGTPGCDDELCCNMVCSQDWECCNPVGLGWDRVCVETAATACAYQGEGDCMVANGTPGCDNQDCAEAVCAASPWCCETEWSVMCAAAAADLCSQPNCPSKGDCSTGHGGPGCDDELCCNSVCLQDPECCDPIISWWDDLCVQSAAEVCTRCPGSGACDLPNATPGCEDFTCCTDVCAADPLCCEVVWDAACARAARDLCGNAACPGDHSCLVFPHAAGCSDEDCCNVVCLHDSECCAYAWDELCVDEAIELCGVRNDDPADGIPVLGGDAFQGSTSDASTDTEALLCGAPDTAPGVWYRIIGTGSDITIDTCSSATDYDTRISVFTGDCPRSLTCVTDNDNACGLQASVTWPSQAGEQYLVLVHGAGTEMGDFELTVGGQDLCLGDFDTDHDVDLADFAGLQRCFTGVGGGPVGPECECADPTRDGNVDLVDYQAFSNVFNGP